VYLRMIEPHEAHVYVFRGTNIDQLFIPGAAGISIQELFVDRKATLAVQALSLKVDKGLFSVRLPDGSEASVGVVQEHGCVTVSSNMPGGKDTLNEAETTVISAILRREELAVFFRP